MPQPEQLSSECVAAVVGSWRAAVVVCLVTFWPRFFATILCFVFPVFLLCFLYFPFLFFATNTPASPLNHQDLRCSQKSSQVYFGWLLHTGLPQHTETEMQQFPESSFPTLHFPFSIFLCPSPVLSSSVCRLRAPVFRLLSPISIFPGPYLSKLLNSLTMSAVRSR